MKLSLTLATLLALAAPVHAGGIGFYQPSKAAASCAEGKANAETEKADLASAQAQLKAAQTAKVKDVGALGQRLQAGLQQHQQEHAQKLAERIQRVVAAVRKAKHLGALVGVDGVLSDLAPETDLTPEVVRRLDAGEGRSTDDAIADLRRQLTEARAQLAAKAPPPPRPPAPPAAKKK